MYIVEGTGTIWQLHSNSIDISCLDYVLYTPSCHLSVPQPLCSSTDICHCQSPVASLEGSSVMRQILLVLWLFFISITRGATNSEYISSKSSGQNLESCATLIATNSSSFRGNELSSLVKKKKQCWYEFQVMEHQP